jgi:hypothetical protein
MSYRNDQSKKSSTAFDQASTLVAVVELSRNSWLVAGVVPGTGTIGCDRRVNRSATGDPFAAITFIGNSVIKDQIGSWFPSV